MPPGSITGPDADLRISPTPPERKDQNDYLAPAPIPALPNSVPRPFDVWEDLEQGCGLVPAPSVTIRSGAHTRRPGLGAGAETKHISHGEVMIIDWQRTDDTRGELAVRSRP